MERKLASIQRIAWLKSIPNADKIEAAGILGWQVVVEKGKHQVGELVVFLEVDSVLPERPEFEFMRERKFRVRTMKMRGAISQGLAMPLSILPSPIDKWAVKYPQGTEPPTIIGMDVTEFLGVTKYEPPISTNLAGVALGAFPTHLVPKTDEQRLQSAPAVLGEIAPFLIYTTVKVDGASVTYYLSYEEPEPHFGVCSRNLELKPDPDNILWRMAEKYHIKEKLTEFLARSEGSYLAVQAELCGPGIAGNHMKLDQHELFVFNVYDIYERRYLGYITAREIVTADFGMTMVPFIARLEPDAQPRTVDEWLAYADQSVNGDPIEGVVVRPVSEEYSKTLAGRLSFKVINNRYLLKNEE